MSGIVACLMALSAWPVLAGPLQQDGWECVPFARTMSGIELYGDAWTWWDKARGVYAEGHRPQPGAVLVFKPHGVMSKGHLAVVSRIVTKRVVMVTHANWSRIDGTRGKAERDVTVIDASQKNDWSLVRVWYRDNTGLGGTTYPTYGFIYGRPVPNAPNEVPVAKPSPQLTGSSPDYVGAMIDSIG
jgi:surface antigen